MQTELYRDRRGTGKKTERCEHRNRVRLFRVAQGSDCPDHHQKQDDQKGHDGRGGYLTKGAILGFSACGMQVHGLNGRGYKHKDETEKDQPLTGSRGGRVLLAEFQAVPSMLEQDQ